MKTLTVLVVDDDPDFLEMLDVGLQLRGYQVIAFDNPADAISAVKAHRPSYDVVVTDWLMPGVSGKMIVDAATSLPNPCPVIVLSGLADTSEIQKSDSAGASTVVTKPITPRQLDELIQRLIKP